MHAGAPCSDGFYTQAMGRALTEGGYVPAGLHVRERSAQREAWHSENSIVQRAAVVVVEKRKWAFARLPAPTNSIIKSPAVSCHSIRRMRNTR